MKAFKYLVTILLTLCFFSCSEDTIDDTGFGTISGTVVLEGSNEPVENARISTNPATSTVFTDAEGKFILSDIPVEDYTVEARKDGLLTRFEGASVMADVTVSVIFEMQTENSNNKQPSTPVAVFPEDKANGIATTTTFKWNTSDPENDDLTYTLEVRNDADEEIFFFSDLTDTIYTVEGLDYNTKYFWQVRASDNVNSEVLSPLFSFRTMDVPESRILFTRNHGSNSVIYAISEDGTESQLTSTSSNSFRPRKNNASNQIAFLRTVGGQTHLFVMNADGSQQRQVTSEVAVNGFNMSQVDFSWADNGASVIFPSFDKLYKIQTTGGGAELIYQTTNGNFITEVAVSSETNRIALITNSSDGYNASIFTIDMSGAIKDQIITNVAGAVGGLDFSIRGDKLLFAHDTSGYQNDSYRRLDSRIFLYDFNSKSLTDLSFEKPVGTNDLDPRFSPNEAEVIFVNTSNDGISRQDIFRLWLKGDREEQENRTLIEENGFMPDWE